MVTTAPLLTIGALAAPTGVPTSALRYHDELGLVRPETRVAGRRRHAESAVRTVGAQQGPLDRGEPRRAHER